MKSLVHTLWGSLLILTTSSFGEAAGPTRIAKIKWTKRWGPFQQWTWCFCLGCPICWSLASVASMRPSHCPCSSTSPLCCIWFLNLVHSTSWILQFTPFFFLTSPVNILSSLSPGPLLPVSSTTLFIPPFTITVLFLKSKPDHVPWSLKILHWLLSVNKKKSKILSREYQTL